MTESANPWELTRATIALMVAAEKRIAEDLRYIEDYAAAARERTVEDEEFLDAAQLAAAALWRDE